MLSIYLLHLVPFITTSWRQRAVVGENDVPSGSAQVSRQHQLFYCDLDEPTSQLTELSVCLNH